MSADSWTALAAGLFGLVVGLGVDRVAGAFPWRNRPAGEETPEAPETAAAAAPGAPAATRLVEPAATRRVPARRIPARRAVVAAGTALLFALTALRFGLSWELPAFLHLTGVAVLLTLIDLRHRLLPNRVLVPAYAVAATLLLVAAAAQGEWTALLRAGGGAVVLFAVFLALALVSPSGLGMGDVKLAGLLGLHLGWLGWSALALGAAAGFVVQALLALVLLGLGRVGLRGELPFGPAMLLGAALAVAG